jgi:hypothetical protein
MSTRAKRSAVDLGRGPGRGCWGMIAPWRHSRSADACAAHAERIAQGLQMSQAHMRPITGVPATIASAMAGFRDLLCRREGFAPARRDVTGLLRSPNKTRQGLDD